MTGKNYPEAIYGTRSGGTMTPKQRAGYVGQARRYAYNRGYVAGIFERYKRDSSPLAGWSNLTEAIQAGERIDWDALNGLEAKCVHPEMGTLTYKLERDDTCPPERYSGWYKAGVDALWSIAFRCSWRGSRGWSLYIKGGIPLRARTADTLEPGTCFRARYKKGDVTFTRAQVVQVRGENRIICFNEYFHNLFASYDPADVEVLEVYGAGTFEKPEEN